MTNVIDRYFGGFNRNMLRFCRRGKGVGDKDQGAYSFVHFFLAKKRTKKVKSSRGNYCVSLAFKTSCLKRCFAIPFFLSLFRRTDKKNPTVISNECEKSQN